MFCARNSCFENGTFVFCADPVVLKTEHLFPTRDISFERGAPPQSYGSIHKAKRGTCEHQGMKP